ncbi:MAG TPA: alpha/beta hydrolase [Phenylobacterium sp.]|nr:alpha/beta hydrolase [Phenylobacterium sp.]
MIASLRIRMTNVLRGAALSSALAMVAGVAFAQPAPPTTLSAEGRAALAEAAKAPQPSGTDVEARRVFLSKFQEQFGEAQRRRYPVEIEASTLGGVPVRIIRPKNSPAHGRRVLINLHGGGFNADSGSLTENIPIAATTGIPVVAVLYRLAPEHPFPAAVDDGLAVYRELLKTHKPSEIGIFGTSAGAVLGPQLIARIHKEGLPQPAVLGMFSGDTDLSRKGDSLSSLPFDITPEYKRYLGGASLTDPLASPALAAAGFFPPTLCVSSTRDFYLSTTANFCRQLELAGVENKLVVFDGLPHAFWSYLAMPEADQAFAVMSRFLGAHLR